MCIYTCIHVFTYTCIVYMYIYVYIYMYVRVYIRIYTCIYIYSETSLKRIALKTRKRSFFEILPLSGGKLWVFANLGFYRRILIREVSSVRGLPYTCKCIIIIIQNCWAVGMSDKPNLQERQLSKIFIKSPWETPARRHDHRKYKEMGHHQNKQEEVAEISADCSWEENQQTIDLT